MSEEDLFNYLETESGKNILLELINENIARIKHNNILIFMYRNFIIDIMDFNGYSRDFIVDKLNELEKRCKELDITYE